MFEIEAIQHENYTELICRGPASLANLKGVVDKIAHGTFPRVGDDKYLIDLRPLIGTIPTVERYELGVYIAQNIPRFKVAAISKPETQSKIGENVAVNRGARILSTDNEAEARAWLLADN
jgi:hypothetical protein